MKRRGFVVLFLVLPFVSHSQVSFVCYTNPKVEQTEDYQKGNVYQKDFLLFMDAVKSAHPYFAGFKDSVAWEKRWREGFRAAGKCVSLSDLEGCMQRILSLLHDSHSTVIFSDSLGKRYPIYLFFDSTGVFLYGASQCGLKQYLGKRVVKINGKPVQKVVESFRPLVSYANETDFIRQLPQAMQSPALWKASRLTKNGRLHILFSDGKEVPLEPVAKERFSLAWMRSAKMGHLVRFDRSEPFNYRLYEDKGICFFQFNICEDQSSYRQQRANGQFKSYDDAEFEEAISQIPVFSDFLEEMFSDIRVNDIHTLVVDIRENGGGNSLLCEQLMSWLMPIEELRTPHSTIRLSELWEQQYPVLAEKYRKMLGNGYELGNTYRSEDLLLSGDNTESRCFSMNTNTENIFKGDVVFVMDEKTYSSAGMLLTMAADNHIGRIIGGKSAFLPCDYGDVLAFSLPNTGVRVCLSHKFFTRPDSQQCADSCMMPDVYIPTRWDVLMSGVDVCWEWVLRKYGTKK